MITVVCGLTEEAKTLVKNESVQVVCGRGPIAKLMRDPSSVTKALISWGTCGALNPTYEKGSVVLSTGVVSGAGFEAHAAPIAATVAADLRDRLLRVETGLVYSDGVTEAATPEQRHDLYVRYGASICDTESFQVATLAHRLGLPFIVARVVTDGAHDTLPPAALVPETLNGGQNLLGVIGSVLKQPTQLGVLLDTGADFDRAIAILCQVAHVFGWGFGFK